MPIKVIDGKFELVCVNHPAECTMVRLETELALPIWKIQPKSIRCMVFTCTICNYVELYLPSEEPIVKSPT